MELTIEEPKLGRNAGHGTKTNHGRKLLVQSTVVGRAPKGVRVAVRSSLAGSFVLSHEASTMKLR